LKGKAFTFIAIRHNHLNKWNYILCWKGRHR